MASKWTTNKALKALNNARADVAKRRDDEDFTYEPWAVPDAEQQANEAEEINRRYAQQQNGPSAAVLAGRQTMSDYNSALKTAQEAAQISRENEQRMLQNALTAGSLDSYKAYKNATAEQQAALENIYSAQNTIPTGFERATGKAKNASKMADQFKTTYGVDDDVYNSLMEGYNTYRQSKSKLASDSYSTLTDSQKDLLDEITESQSSKQGSAAYRAQSKINQLKQETSVDDDTLNMWQTLRNDEKNVRVSASNASKISADAINGLSGEARTALDNYIKGYQQSQKAAGSGSFFENLKGQLTNPLSQTKAISEGGQLMENARQQLKTLGYSDSDIKKYEEYAQVYAEDSLMQEDKENAKKHPLTSNANAILTDATVGMANGLAQFGADIGDMARYNTEKSLYGNAAKANTSPNNFGAGHGGGARAARYASNVQEATQDVITKDNGEDATLIQKVGNELYKMGYSAAQSHLTNIVGALGSAALGSNIAGELVSLIPAFGNTYYQGKMNAEERGLSNDKAFHTAFAEARHEVETEVLSDRMLGLIFKEDTVKNVLKETLKGAAEEGGEEVANNILNAITDRVINGDKSELNQSVQNYMSQGSTQQEAVVQTATDFIRDSAYAFLTAAGSTIIGMAPNAAARTIDNRVTGNRVFGSNTAQDYRDLQESYDLDESKASYPQVKEAYDLAGKYAEKLENGGKVTTSERAKLWDTTNGIGAIEQAAAENAERDEKLARIKNNIKGIFSNKTENATEQNNETTTDSAQESISDVSNVPEEYRSEKNNTSYNDAYKAIQSSTTQDELNEAMQTAKNSEEISWEDYEKLEQTAGSYAASKNNLDLEQAKISTEDAYTAGYSGQEIGTVSPALQIAYNDGVQQAASDRAEQKAMHEEAVQKAAAKQHNDGLRTIIESNYQDGMNASTYNAVMASAINAGRTGMTFEDYAQENGTSLAVVGEDIAKTAFKAGQKVAISDALKEAARSLGEKTNVKSYGIGSYTDARTDNKESIKGEGVFKAVAQMTGLNIVLTDDGFGDNDNGYYQSSNSTIYINTNQADRMASTLFHEVGEFASVWNQKEYASVVNDIMQASQKALGSREFDRLRQKYANAYQGETNKTDADIDKEMANDLLYQFLGNEQGMNKLMAQIDQNHGYKEAKSIKQRLADWIGRMVDSIKNFLSELQPNSYQRRMAEATLQNYEALQDSIVKSIANAEKNYSDARAATAETRAIEQGKGSIEDYGVENESSGEKRLSIETYEHGGREYLENFLENTDDLTEEQKDDILDHMEWAYNLAKDLAKSNQYEYFGQWSQTALAKSKDGVPLIEVRTASDSKPIRSVAVNNGEYPLNIDFSQVCKKRSTLNAVLNYMVKNYGMNLRTLTASDVININQAIKNHGFEIACGLCFVDAKRYRTGAWASTFTEGTRNKKGELNANQPGYNNLVRMIRPKDGSDVGYSYFNFATSIPTESVRTIDQLSDDELDLSRLQRKIGRYARYDENGNLIGIGGYKDNAGKTKNPTETIRLAWAIYSNPEMRHLISEEDLISSDGLDAMRDQNSTLYSLVNAHWGAGKPKLSHGGTAYGNEILRSTEWGSKNDFNPESAAKVGGVRVQSFSDYEANMFFDYMQLFADMSARQLTSHGYTKEPYYAKLFGMTGQKINLSVVAKAAELTAEQQARYEKLVNKSDKALMEDPEFKEIAEHAGLGKDENGNWTRLLVEDETFPLQEALDLQKDQRYNSNCGIIWIGISDAQIRVLLDSNDVPMVIPYHSSGVSRIVKKARNLLLYTDYTNKQNTRTKDGKKITGKDFDFYGSLAKTNDVITTTNEYLAWCKEHDYLPKFDQFADHPNYYKLLIDFRAYDYNGIDPEKMANRVYQPQQKITMNFPENFNDLVAASLAEQQATKDLEAKEFTDAQGSLLNDVKDVLGLNDDGSRAAGGDVRHSYDISVDEKLAQMVEEVKEGTYAGNSSYTTTERISDETADKISKIVGFSVKGYSSVISTTSISHVIYRHGDHGVADHSMADPEDIARVAYVINNADKVWGSENRSNEYKDSKNRPSQMVVMQKKIDDGFYYVVEAVPESKKHRLGTVTMYRNKKDTSPLVSNTDNGPVPHALDELPANVSNTSVSQNTANGNVVNTNDDGNILYDGKVATESQIEESDIGIRRSVRIDDPPKKTITAYKVFVAFENDPGHLYPPMVASPGGVATPVGVWLDADTGTMARDKEGNIIVNSKGRVQVQQGGKGTNKAKSGTLAWRPGWHLGEYPDAKQFAVKDPVTGKAKSAFPAHFIFAECEIAADVDYQLEAMEYGVSEKGGFNRTQAGLPYVPKNGSYRYRTNADPTTAPWYITGSMKVNRILDDADIREICAKFGVTPLPRVGGDIDLSKYGFKKGEVAPTEDLSNLPVSEDYSEEIKQLPGYVRRKLNFDDPTVMKEFEIDHISKEKVAEYAAGYGSQLDDKRKSLNIDSDDNALTESQQKYFENSKVRDNDGRLLVMYHGTGADFTEFDRKYIGSHGSFEGYGFNFTPDKSRASGYSNGRILEGYLNVTNPLSDSEITMTTREFADLIAEADPTGDDIIANYARNTRDYGTPAFVKREAMTTAKLIMESAQSDVDLYSEISAAGGGDNLIDLFKRMGYDGLIHHNDDGTIKTVITFDSNQFKNADNQNPTFLADIRRAVGIDETWDDGFDWSAEGEQIQSGLADALKSGNEILKGTTVNEANIRRIARQLKDQYSSRISVDELADTLTKVFAYAQNQDYINYNDLATVISEVASPMIEQSTVKTGAQEFKDFKQALQSYTFNLDERQQKEVISAFGSWGAFRKALPGIKFTRDGSGISLDGVWNSLCRESGYVLSRDVTSNDMPLELVDAYNAMKPTYENAFGEDAMNATQDAAMEIISKYYQYEAQQEKNELKKKQKEDLENLSKKIAQTNAEMRKNLQQKYNERLEKELAKVKKENKPERVSVQVARLRARNAKTVASLRENQKRKEKLKYLNKIANRAVEMLTNPTDQKHIPKMIQTPVMQLISAVDAIPETVRETADGKYTIRIIKSKHMNDDGSYSYEWKTIKADTVQDAVAQYKKAMEEYGFGSSSARRWQDNLNAVHELYTQEEEDDWYERSELKQGLDKELGEQLGKILKDNQGILSIAELSSDEIQTVIDVFRNVMHAANQINRMYSMPSQEVTDVAHQAMDRMSSGANGRKAHGEIGNIFLDTFTLDHATPETFFHGLFGTKETDPITKILLKAQNQKSRDIRQAQEYMEGFMTDDIRKAVKGWMYDAHSKDHNTRNFYGMDLTVTQVMSLYELMKREDAQQHKPGGFIVDMTGRKDDGRHNVVHLTDEQIKSITDTLSEEQKRIADAMQYYMAHQCAEQGNETAMQLYGYDKYLDEHYFPMATDKNAVATRNSNVSTGTINAIKNSGFTKKITPNANNALVLKDIFTVFADHVSDMATYHSWAAPIQDIIRFYNFNEKETTKVGEEEFISRTSVKDAFDYFYGKGGQQYMTKLLASINQMEKSNLVGGDFMQMMTGNAKSAAVMGNIRVVVQQPTAFFRAGEMISYKYLKDGLTGKYSKEAAELRDRTSDVFWLKSQGNIDGYITQSMVSTITGVQTRKEQINEKAGFLAGKADEVTWAAMYRAVYAEQVDKLGKAKIGTQEFEDAVNDRFSEIMLRTQVYDGTITRSQFMRSTDWYNKMASAFMAEPVKTYNIVLRHMIDLAHANNEKDIKAAKQGIRRAAGVLTLTNVANAVVQSLWDSFRNAGDADGEDENFWERFLEAIGLGFLVDDEEDTIGSATGKFLSGNFVDNMDLLGNIPLVADRWDAVKTGFSSAILGESSYSSDSDLSMSAINNFFSAVKTTVNPSEKMTNYGKFAAIARGFSDMTGIPVYAVQRDAVAIYNVLAKDVANGLAGTELPVLQKTSKYTKAQQAKLDVYAEAMNSGDFKQAIEDAYNAGNSYESIRNSIKAKCKDEYLALKESNPSEATQMKNRLAQMYVYLADKTGTYKDKTDAEKLKKYTENIEKWGESEEDETEE